MKDADGTRKLIRNSKLKGSFPILIRSKHPDGTGRSYRTFKVICTPHLTRTVVLSALPPAIVFIKCVQP